MRKESKALSKTTSSNWIFDDKVRVGLDIGAYAVKVVQVKETSKGCAVVKLGYREIPKLQTSISQIESNALVSTIAELWREQKIGVRQVRLVISDPAVYTRHISVPAVSEEELSKAIQWQAEKYIPFSVDNASVDFQTLALEKKGEDNQKEIVVVAAEKKIVDKYISILREAKLTPIVLDIAPFALARAFLKNYSLEKDEIVPVVDIGAHATSIVVVNNQGLMLVRTIESGGNAFTRAIAQALRINKTEAERMKQKGGEDIVSMVTPVFSELTSQINRSLAYCERECLSAKINRIILCGGGAKILNVDKILGDSLGIPVELADPFRNMITDPNVRKSSSLEEIAPKMMTVLGSVV